MANNLIKVTSTNPNRGEYLIALSEFQYLKSTPGGNTKIASSFTMAMDTVQESVASLAPLGGNDLVVFTDVVGATVAANRIFVSRVLPNLDGTAEIIFIGETSMRSRELYTALRPAFVNVTPGGGISSVLVDGVTITGDGTTIALEVGLINSTNIPANAILLSDLAQINTAKLLGRFNAGVGDIEEIAIGSGLDLSALGVLSVLGAAVLTDGVIITGDGAPGNEITLADNSLATIKYIANSVTFAKLQQVNSQVLLGRYSASTGNVETISLGSGLSLSGAGVLSRTADAVSGANNGLKVTSGVIQMGALLIEDTTIDGASAAYDFTLTGIKVLDLMANVLGASSTTTLTLTAGTNLVLAANANTTLNCVDFGAVCSGVIDLGATGAATLSGATVDLVASGAITATSMDSVVLDSEVVQLGATGGTSVVSVGDQYDLPSPSPVLPSNGDIQIAQWRNDAGNIIAEFVAKPGSGSGGGSWYDITPVADFVSVRVFASGPGVTFVQNSSNEWFFVVPTGVDLYGGVVYAETAANPGGTLYVRYTFDGLGPDGGARVVNADLESLRPPTCRVINMTVANVSFGGPTRLLPAAFNRISGSSLLEENIVGAPGVGAATYLEMQYVNYNANSVGGNNETMYIFNF